MTAAHAELAAKRYCGHPRGICHPSGAAASGCRASICNGSTATKLAFLLYKCSEILDTRHHGTSAGPVAASNPMNLDKLSVAVHSCSARQFRAQLGGVPTRLNGRSRDGRFGPPRTCPGDKRRCRAQAIRAPLAGYAAAPTRRPDLHVAYSESSIELTATDRHEP